MNTPDVDQRGRAAAASVHAEVAAWTDVERTLSSIGFAPTESHRRNARTVVAAVSCLVIVVIVLLSVVALSPGKGRPTAVGSRDAYSFVPSGLPKGFHPVVAYPSTDGPTAVTYARFYGDVPRISIFVSDDQRGINGRVTQTSVRGHAAKVGGFPDRFGGAEFVVRWKEAGHVVMVAGKGLSRKEVVAAARQVRPVGRTEFERSIRDVPNSPWAPDIGLSDPMGTDTNHRVLAEANATDGSGELVVYERSKADGVRWLCVESRESSGFGTVCADPEHGFSVPELNGGSNYRWVVASLRPGESIRVDLDDGSTLDARTYDTGEGERPVLAYIDLGIRERLPQGAVVLEDPRGEVVRRWRFPPGT